MNNRSTSRDTWARRVLIAARLLVAAIVSGLLLAGGVLMGGSPAWASCTTSCSASGNVSASVSVASTILMSLSASSLDFGQNQQANSTSSGVPPIVATISTNDAAGYALSVSATDFNSVIKANDLQVTETTTTALQGNLQFAGTKPLVEAGSLILAGSGTPSGPTGDAYTSALQLFIPANAPGGSASSTITFVAAAA